MASFGLPVEDINIDSLDQKINLENSHPQNKLVFSF